MDQPTTQPCEACELCGTFVEVTDRYGCEHCGRMVCAECLGESGDYCEEHNHLAEASA
jgi:hypothetical protein